MQEVQNFVVSHKMAAPPKMKAPPPPTRIVSNVPSKNGKNLIVCDQKNRSMKVMIPRAKYCPTTQGGQQSAIILVSPQDHIIDTHHPILIQTNQQPISLDHSSIPTQMTITQTDSLCSNNEAKILSYLDASPSTSKVYYLISFT